MAEKGSFWSSLPGVLTGIAGVATAVVALLSLAASQGWIGSGGDGGDAPARIEVAPTSLQFRAVPGTASGETVTVTNGGDAPVRLEQPEITGADADRFELNRGNCTGQPLPAGRSCEVVVTFSGGLTADASATLVITPENGRAAEVRLEAGVF
jgi:hypothetical protein